jgi:DnaJ-class molecular chaperone
MRPVGPVAGKTVQVEHGGTHLMQVPCAFCGGQGKDPFGIMSWLSTCCVCGGRGVVQVRAPFRRCAYCRGTGAIKTFTCTVCRGTGYVTLVPGPLLTCPECRGQGEDASSALACLACRGRGWVPPETQR